jgi:hypothetical protein
VCERSKGIAMKIRASQKGDDLEMVFGDRLVARK